MESIIRGMRTIIWQQRIQPHQVGQGFLDTLKSPVSLGWKQNAANNEKQDETSLKTPLNLQKPAFIYQPQSWCGIGLMSR